MKGLADSSLTTHLANVKSLLASWVGEKCGETGSLHIVVS